MIDWISKYAAIVFIAIIILAFSYGVMTSLPITPTQSEKNQTIQNAGYEWGKQGLPWEANPYRGTSNCSRDNTEEGQAWIQGWMLGNIERNTNEH